MDFFWWILTGSCVWCNAWDAMINFQAEAVNLISGVFRLFGF